MIQTIGWILLTLGVCADVFVLISKLRWNRGKKAPSGVPFFPFLLECWGMSFLANEYMDMKFAPHNFGAILLTAACFHLLCQIILPLIDRKFLLWKS